MLAGTSPDTSVDATFCVTGFRLFAPMTSIRVCAIFATCQITAGCAVSTKLEKVESLGGMIPIVSGSERWFSRRRGYHTGRKVRDRVETQNSRRPND